jgi:adenylate kinase
MAIYLVGGPTGVGKSTFLARLGAMSDEWSIVHSSAVLMKRLNLKDGDYQSLQRIDKSVTLHAFSKLLIEYIQCHRKQSKRPNLIFDCHYLTMISGQTYAGLEHDVLSEFDGLIMLIASAETIFQRIARGSERARGMFPAESEPNQQLSLLAEFLERLEREFDSLATESGLPATKIPSEDGKIDEALDSFFAFHTLVSDERRV